MHAPTAGRRRRLARAFSRVADASVAEALTFAAPPPDAAGAWRIGITGPPGAGKSSLIARLAKARLARLRGPGRAPERLAVLAIDPSSPLRGGAILGDRVRMDAIADDPRVYVRSLASRGGDGGLADNIVDLLALADAHAFDELILETVGVGQSEHAARALVDTLVLVLHPDAGDSIQAMKSGIMEVADIYVVNKADLPAARRTAIELKAVLKALPPPRHGWTPPVVLVAQGEEAGIGELDAALERHRDHLAAARDAAAVRRGRRAYHLRSLLRRRVGELLAADVGVLDLADMRHAYAAVLRRLAQAADGDEADAAREPSAAPPPG